MNNDIEKIFFKGYRAYCKNKLFSENPYEGELKTEWADGWKAAETDWQGERPDVT